MVTKVLRNAATRFEFQNLRTAAQNLTSTRMTHSSEFGPNGTASDGDWDERRRCPVFKVAPGLGAGACKSN